MKKIYCKPETQFIAVQLTNMVALSTFNEAASSEEVYSRESSWDDDEDDY